MLHAPFHILVLGGSSLCHDVGAFSPSGIDGQALSVSSAFPLGNHS